MTGQVVDQVPATDIASWSLRMPADDRPWGEMWVLVQYNLARIEDHYAQRVSRHMVGLKCDVLNFCVAAYHLLEHVECDPALPIRVRDGLPGEAKSDRTIAVAGDVSNTLKHYKRDSPSRRARIVGLTSAPTATIGWTDRDSKQPAEQDALAFARQVTATWRALLVKYKLIN